ncbi:zinc finger CCHC domain-containing protein 7 isoform X1 [Tachyglossus aculeatus]|uniref:zinc finger CCHC domain-containing protein 7 isoform X1 n=1 Tax=Tachyglossus aculeatus TaxID=9261 RepID=UPI0018F77405|nr:zinc finger CCHC domain-containing protein 7 isoform X1 [Tachyglossus aculeatus]
MFGGYENIEAYENDLYREESSSELSVDSEVEFQLYSQVHYAQDLGESSRENHTEEKSSGNSESVGPVKGNQNNLIILSDTDVIQISDGPEVITVSDDEDSVYTCKRKNAEKTAQVLEGPDDSTADIVAHSSLRSTAATIKASKTGKFADEKSESGERSRLIQEVLLVGDSSDTEEECSASESGDSDNVESWMLLGCEVDDNDDNILLNLVGCETPVSEGESEENWSISNKDIEAQIGNKTAVRQVNRYYSGNKNVTCRNCREKGHLSKNCPVPQKSPTCCLCGVRGHLQYNCPARLCLDCSLPASYPHKCFEKSAWKKTCHRCDMIGHYADACPEIWRQYHLTTRPGPPKKPETYSGRSALVYCYNCSQKGHYGFECTERRMFSGIFPASPFIYYYDGEYDIRKREQRIKWKMEELQEFSGFPRQFKRPHLEAEAADQGHYHRIKSHAEYEVHRWPRGEKYSTKAKSQDRNQKHQEKKHRKSVPKNHDMEEDFPRGPKTHSSHCSTKTRKKSHHSSHLACQKLNRREHSKEGKQRKHKKKWKGGDDEIDESLFVIKQRKKKPKLN